MSKSTVKTMRQILGPTANEYAEGRMRIPVGVMLRIEFLADEDGEWCYTTPDRFEANGKRMANLRISSYTEIGSAGAMHWYADISVHTNASYDHGDGRTGIRGGYLGEHAKALGIDKWVRTIKIEVRRKIKSGERDANGERLGRTGEMTRRLNSKQEAYDLAIALFERRFGPGWALVDDRALLYAHTIEEALVAES